MVASLDLDPTIGALLGETTTEIDVARKNPNPAVKKQAIFWLGQSRDPRAIDFFAAILK